MLQNPAARAGPRLSYTKPETARRDGSNEVTWAFNESLLALLFTHHRFLLNRSIAAGGGAGRARARDGGQLPAPARPGRGRAQAEAEGPEAEQEEQEKLKQQEGNIRGTTTS